MAKEEIKLITDLETIREDSLRPIRQWGTASLIWIGFLSIVMLWGLYCYIYQLRNGLGATHMRNYVSWGMYIVFIVVSQLGTLVSGILRITKQPWRMPITRSAELMTFVSLCFGGIQPIIDL